MRRFAPAQAAHPGWLAVSGKQEVNHWKQGAVIATLVACSGLTHAALFDRGNGLIYDSSLNVTWLADWNYAKTSGFDADGRMNWATANAWASQLVYAGLSGWRLPTIAQPDTSCSQTVSPPGGAAAQYLGYGCLGAEMGHLFYADLGGQAGQSILNQAGDTDLEKANLALFRNVQAYDYWTATAYAPSPDNAWSFHTSVGNLSYGDKILLGYALAVRPGDVAAVPEPQPGVLLMLGLGVVAALARRRTAA